MALQLESLTALLQKSAATTCARSAVPTIPPRRNASFSRAKDPPPFRAERDAILRRIQDVGRYSWRTSIGAGRQSPAENAVSRFKALVGVKLASRDLERQQVETLVRSQVLNRMAGSPVPEGNYETTLARVVAALIGWNRMGKWLS